MQGRILAGALLGLSLGAAGCGGDDDGDGGAATPDAGGGGGGGACDEPPCLEPPEQGFQVRNEGVMIQPGEDVEYCEVVVLPGGPSDTYHVNRFSSEMTTGSHHLIVAAIEPGSETDAQAEPGDRVECFGPSPFGDDLIDVTGQQLPYHEESFPPGVGRVYTGGQKVVFNYHYLNTSDEPLLARAAVNFHTTDAASVEKIAETFGKIYFPISVPPGESRSYEVSCTMSTDVMVHKLTRHTHQWGTDFPVYFSGGERDGELIYTSPNYEDPDFVFAEPILVEAGQGFRFVCNYVNTTTGTLTFGESASHEMCILFGTMYSPTERDLPSSAFCQ